MPQKYELVFEKGTWGATISVSEGRIEGLLVRPGASAAGSLEDAVAPLRAFPGKVGFTLIADGKTLEKEDDALAVGSSFKLAVLVELRDRIETEASPA